MRNLPQGIYCDTGGSVFNSEYISNKELRRLWQDLARRFDDTYKILQKYKYRTFDILISKDIDNNINIFDANYINNFLGKNIILKKDKIVLKTFIKNLEYASNMIKKAEEKGLKDELIKIFNKDMQKEFPYKNECWNGIKIS